MSRDSRAQKNGKNPITFVLHMVGQFLLSTPMSRWFWKNNETWQQIYWVIKRSLLFLWMLMMLISSPNAPSWITCSLFPYFLEMPLCFFVFCLKCHWLERVMSLNVHWEWGLGTGMNWMHVTGQVSPKIFHMSTKGISEKYINTQG